MGKETPNWYQELQMYGWKFVLTNRLEFHNVLTIEQIAENAGVSGRTAYKHCRRLVESGIARFTNQSTEFKNLCLTLSK